MVSIRLPVALAERAGGDDTVFVDADDVAGALSALGERHPEIATLVFAADGTIRPFVNVFLGDRAVGLQSGEQETVRQGDQIRIVPSIAGG